MGVEPPPALPSSSGHAVGFEPADPLEHLSRDKDLLPGKLLWLKTEFKNDFFLNELHALHHTCELL